MPVRRCIPKPRVGIWREIQAHVTGPEPREHAAVVNVLRARIRQTEAEAFGARLPHVRCSHNHAHKRVCIKRARRPALRSCAAVSFCTLLTLLLNFTTNKRVCIKRARRPALRSCAAVSFCTFVLALLVQKHKY